VKFDELKFEIENEIAIVTLNRPDKLNAITAHMVDELIAAIDRIDADDGIRAAIFTGAGRAFCAGYDLSSGTDTFDSADMKDSPVRSDGTIDYSKETARDAGGILTMRMFRCLKPLIGAINGACVGMGVTIMLPMDIRLASDTAKFGLPFTRRGVIPESASSYFLPKIVGISKALEWTFKANIFPAEEAKAAGLVSDLYPEGEVLAAAKDMAKTFVDGTSPVSIALSRQMLWEGAGMSHPMEAHRIDSRGVVNRGRSDDVKEGVTAFLEKRPPEFPERVSDGMPDYYPWGAEPKYS